MSQTVEIPGDRGVTALSSEATLAASTVDHRKRWMSLIGKGCVAVIDQGLTAACHFLIGLLLARWLSPSE